MVSYSNKYLPFGLNPQCSQIDYPFIQNSDLFLIKIYKFLILFIIIEYFNLFLIYILQSVIILLRIYGFKLVYHIS